MKCQREVGRIEHWHECGRSAAVASERQIGSSTYTLYFCDRHAHCANVAGSQKIFVRRVYELRPIDVTEAA